MLGAAVDSMGLTIQVKWKSIIQYLLPREKRLFQIGAQDIFVFAVDFPVFRAVDGSDIRFAVAFPFIKHRVLRGSWHGTIKRVLAVSVGVQLEFKRGQFVVRSVFKTHLHRTRHRTALWHIFRRNLIPAMGVLLFLTGGKTWKKAEKQQRKQDE